MINLNLKPVWSLPAQKPSNKQSARLHCNCASGNANACVTLSLAHQPTTTHPAKKNHRVEQKKRCKSFSHLIRWWATIGGPSKEVFVPKQSVLGLATGTDWRKGFLQNPPWTQLFRIIPFILYIEPSFEEPCTHH